MKNTAYDGSWDEGNGELWDKKYAEWETRDWVHWLSESLTFPFEVQRKEDFDSNPFLPTKDEPFSRSHIMTVLAIVEKDEEYGMLAKVKEGRKTGVVPLCNLQVTSRADENFWPVREYVVWFAHR